LARRAKSRELQKFCKEGVAYTRHRITRLKKALKVLEAPGTSIASSGLDGLVRDAKRAAAARKSPATDVAILGAIERISHYGLAAYTTIDRYLRKAHAAGARRILAPSAQEKRDAIAEMSRMASRKLLPRLEKS
jgi:ferritin-like metal-binding protein YciE